MAFVLCFPIVIPCLLERVVTCFNVFKKIGSFLEETVWFFFCGSWKYLICFLFWNDPPLLRPIPISWKKLHVNNMWDFNYWTRHECQKVDSFFWICCFSSKLSCHSHQQQVWQSLFLIRTLVKTNSNVMCVSL